MDAASSISSPFDVPPKIALRDEAPAADLAPVQFPTLHKRIEMRFLATQIRARFGERKEALEDARRQPELAVVGRAKTADEELNEV